MERRVCVNAENQSAENKSSNWSPHTQLCRSVIPSASIVAFPADPGKRFFGRPLDDLIHGGGHRYDRCLITLMIRYDGGRLAASAGAFSWPLVGVGSKRESQVINSRNRLRSCHHRFRIRFLFIFLLSPPGGTLPPARRGGMVGALEVINSLERPAPSSTKEAESLIRACPTRRSGLPEKPSERAQTSGRPLGQGAMGSKMGIPSCQQSGTTCPVNH